MSDSDSGGSEELTVLTSFATKIEQKATTRVKYLENGDNIGVKFMRLTHEISTILTNHASQISLSNVELNKNTKTQKHRLTNKQTNEQQQQQHQPTCFLSRFRAGDYFYLNLLCSFNF